jgi:endonuclease/exonuclease/phosphatase family metal-dependent hydrolase
MRLPLERVEHLRFPPAGGGEQRSALLATIQVGSRSVTVAAGHLSNRQGHNARQLRDLQQVAAARAAPRLLVGDLKMPSTVLLLASRRAGPRPAGVIRPREAQGGRRPRQRPPRPGVELDIAASDFDLVVGMLTPLPISLVQSVPSRPWLRGP